MEVRVAHRMDPKEVARRIRDAGRKRGLEEIDGKRPGTGHDDELGGAFAKGTPMGAVAASWNVTPDEVVVRVLKKPSFLPGSTVARLLEDGLRDVLEDG